MRQHVIGIPRKLCSGWNMSFGLPRARVSEGGSSHDAEARAGTARCDRVAHSRCPRRRRCGYGDSHHRHPRRPARPGAGTDRRQPRLRISAHTGPAKAPRPDRSGRTERRDSHGAYGQHAVLPGAHGLRQPGGRKEPEPPVSRQNRRHGLGAHRARHH